MACRARCWPRCSGTGQAHPCAAALGRGPVPAWVSNVVVPNFSNGVIRACADGEGDTLVFEIVNNRKYPMVMTYGQPVQWGWTQEPGSLGDNLVSAAINGRVGSSNQLFLPPLSCAAIGVSAW